MESRTIVAIAVALVGASGGQHATKDSPDADAKARKIVARAIDAAGGQNALRRIKSATGKCKGVFYWLDAAPIAAASPRAPPGSSAAPFSASSATITTSPSP
jgi:hypothetical protein